LLACLRLWHCQVNERDAQHLNLRLKRSITSCSNTIFTPKNDPRRWYDPDSEEGAYRVNVARSQHQHNSTLLLSRVLKHLEISDLFSYSFLDAVSTWLLITPSSSFICHL
jgi:hypothetical protein